MAIKIKGTTIINDENAYIDLAGNSALKVPVGSLGERPTGVTGLLRYNSTDNTFEGYDGTEWGPIGGAGEAGDSATVSQTAPEDPVPGSLWWNSTTGTLKIYYDDGVNQQWVDASPTLKNDFSVDDANLIDAPTAIAPKDDVEIAQGTTFNLEASEYSDNMNGTHASSDWQVSNTIIFDTVEFESLEDTDNLTSFEVTNGIADPGTYYWRVRYRNLAGNVSNFSIPARFGIFIPPPELGDAFGGGFYIGTTSVGATCYYLIVAPNVTGCAACSWKATNTATVGTASLVDGFANTYPALNDTTHRAGNWTATRTIGGFSDWYLPARDELNQLYVNDGGATNTNLPAGEGFAAAVYWSSTEGTAITAIRRYFSSGNIGYSLKTDSNRVRAVRRTPI